MKKRLLSLLLALSLLAGMCTIPALASDQPDPVTEPSVEQVEPVQQTDETADQPDLAAEPSVEQAEPAQPSEEPADREEPTQPSEEPADQEEPAQPLDKAADPEEPIQQTKTFVYVNPLYKDAPLPPMPEPSDASQDASTRAVTYVEPKKAAAQLRDAMVDRSAHISLAINLGIDYDYDYEAAYTYFIKTIFPMAFSMELAQCPYDGDYLRWSWASISASMDGYGTKWVFDVYPYYYTTAQQERELAAGVDRIVQELNLGTMHTYDRYAAIYDYVTSHVTYDYEGLYNDDYLTFTAYKALTQGTAVCQGYATLYYALCWKAGLPIRIVTSETHAWNIAKLGGKWYFLDSTWDAEAWYGWDYFMLGSNNLTDPDHALEEDYLTKDFQRNYPISATNYDPNTPPEHVWDAGRITKAATCKNTGVKTYTCTVCGTTKTETIPKLTTHTYDKGKVTKAATCKNTGVKTYTCTVCGATKTETISKLSHTLVKKNAKAATCTKNGYSGDQVCTRCGETVQKGSVIQKLGHSWNKGTVTKVSTKQYEGIRVRTCTRCGTTKNVAIPVAGTRPDNHPFVDVPDSAYYALPVFWALDNDITNGTSQTTFGPDSFCTRAQAVTFLWRAAGCPEPKNKNNPFTDVKPGEYYYDAVLWAVENNITNGVALDRFAPKSTCTRGQIVTFLWRFAGKPAASSSRNPFSDVVSKDYYYQAVLWAVEQGITNGVALDRFAPINTCTRSQIVTFLYRAIT